MKSENSFWIRKIQKYTKNSINQSILREALTNTPVEIIRELSISVELYYKQDFFHLGYQKSMSTPLCNLYPHHIAASLGNFKLMQYIIEKNEVINPYAQYGQSPFHEASFEGHLEICQLIIQNIRNKNPGDSWQITPLHLAAKEGHTEICKMILKNIGKSNFWFKILPLHLRVFP